MNYYNNYFTNVKPSDDFGYSPEWNIAVNDWLEFIFQSNQEFYISNKKRVIIDKQRYEFLGEAKSFYFIGKILNLPIVEIEPQGKDRTLLDFSFTDLSRELWKAEVKSPSWIGQIWKDANMTTTDKKIRVQQPKVRSGEGGSFSAFEEIDQTLKDSVVHALPKFKEGENNLLIITPDMRMDTITMMAIESMASNNAVRQLMRIYDIEHLISTVLILEPRHYSDKILVEYIHKFVPISKTPNLPNNAVII